METNEWITGEVVIGIAGEPVKMHLTVPAGPVKPQRMLPVFHKITNTFIEMVSAASDARGSAVTCQKGCAACCRQPIPLTEIEVYHIAELVKSMPEPLRTEIDHRFTQAAEHFESLGWFERLRKVDQLRATGQRALALEELKTVAIDYLNEWVDCPFLEDESCMIHADRPLSCREYLVTSPPPNCWQPTPDNISRVSLAVFPSSIVSDLAATGALRGSILLIQALEFAERNPESFPVKTGERWTADFFGRLTDQEIPETSVPGTAETRRKRPQKLRKKRQK
ncbi:MAG TPA: YkgJ family cysteine cluster protein [Pyrinomonadaceae bacterium]|jgi:Fe-S-cluster containining protein